MKQQKQLIEILGDVANFKELIYSMLISSVAGLAGYILAPQKAPAPLIFGLLALVVAFIITNRLFKPKRIIRYDKEQHNDN